MKYNEKYDRYITNDGLVYRKNKDGILVLCKQTNYNGYLRICVVKPSHKLLRVHRLVWETFNGEIPNGYEIDHFDGNKQNNALSNLQCVTHTENMNNKITKSRISNTSLNNTKRRRKVFSEFGIKFKEHFGFAGYDNRQLYNKEWHYNKRHNKCSWE